MPAQPDIVPFDSSVLVVGAGIAGLYAALKLAPRPVTIVTAAPLGQGGSSAWAQGGLAAAVGADDSTELHLHDTLAAGAGLVDARAARTLVEAGSAIVEDLLRLGVPFDRDAGGRVRSGREAAHSRARIVHAGGDKAGAAIMTALAGAARAAAHITIRERIVVEDLLTDEHGGVCGVLTVDIVHGVRVRIPASDVVLATGGAGGLFAVTTNHPNAQGGALAIASRAGAEIMDAEFVQFHPTAIDIGADPAPLATEALRGAGATLIDAHGRRFMPALHDSAELAPRDVVARGVAAAIAETGAAFLDARIAVGVEFPAAYPTVFGACMAAGIDPRSAPIPVAPAAHYHMGGVRTDLDGRAGIPGLWAVGEAACTGVHGANRLASNSLLEALVFGARAAGKLRENDAPPPRPAQAREDRLALSPKPADGPALQALRKAMTADCALLRDANGLSRILAHIAEIDADPARTSGLANAAIAARLIAQAALAREESRGGHFRTDYPHTEQGAPRHSIYSNASSSSVLEPAQ